ncbi:MAG TPA: hypothetical protein VK550_18665 [Polyangiaceae bacterium]|nr:hypothetical protein [Polyangiaceae bacterium]
MSALLRWWLLMGCLAWLTGCPEKKSESGGSAPPTSSSAPAKGTPAPGSGGW